MALTLDAGRADVESLEDYVDQVARNVDPRDDDSVIESAGLLRALAEDRDLIARRFNRDLERAMEPVRATSETAYVSTTFLLARGPGFMVRANLWLPPNGFGRQAKSISDLNLYQLPHDHDFSFLTIGYWGSGYATSIYEYDPRSIAGEPGEQIDIRFLEHTTLPVGKVMYYRASRDIHTQEYPLEPSISLNLLLVPPQPRPQYAFDVERGRVSGLISNRSEAAVDLCTFARYVSDNETQDHLDQIASTHPNPRLRWAAYDSLRALQPDQEPTLLSRALADPSDLVKHAARRLLGSSQETRTRS